MSPALCLLDDALHRAEELIAPAHIVGEVANAIYKRYRAGTIDLDELRSSMRAFVSLPVRLVHTDAVAERALEIAAEFRLPTPYDTFYLAVAELLDCDLWTADSRLVNAVGAGTPRLRLLSTYRA
ncbi:MAG: type II toxin-antitoxin system VapC family toxin [Dehalococcoidia bacterium]